VASIEKFPPRSWLTSFFELGLIVCYVAPARFFSLFWPVLCASSSSYAMTLGDAASEPSQLSGQIQQAKGQIYSVRFAHASAQALLSSFRCSDTLPQTIGAISSNSSWKDQGHHMTKKGQDEIAQARLTAKADAGVDRLYGKAQSCVCAPHRSENDLLTITVTRSAYGLVTGDQEKTTEGNLRAEGAEWKAAAADGELPSVSVERVKGKIERCGVPVLK
jgi:hypothetical protein